ncbi:MAG: metallophosphoesterase [Lachnobacterium sp.]|nr:metallophosphoesterase [Lachnobacterium sp.]
MKKAIINLLIICIFALVLLAGVKAIPTKSDDALLELFEEKDSVIACPEELTDVLQDKGTICEDELLNTICEGGAQPDIIEAKTAIRMQRLNYMVVCADAGIEEYMTSLDFSLIGQADAYLVYKYNYPWYTAVSDETEIQSRKQIMGLHENEITIDLGLKNEYTILTLNDLQLITMDQSVNSQYVQDVESRYLGFCSGTGIKTIDMWSGMSSVLDSYHADGICFIGDMLDYDSDTMVDLFETGLTQIKTPYIYLRADHDLGVWYTDGSLTREDAIASSSGLAQWDDVLIQDYNEFYVVGWNNSTSQLSEHGLQQMKDVFEQAKEADKPIILMTHVPINSLIDSGLENQAQQYDAEGRAKLWGHGCLYEPDSVTEEFLNMVFADDSPVRAVIAAHLHFSYAVDIKENLPEYVMEPAFYGGIGMLRVK